MNSRASLTDLGAFTAVVANRSFRKAADELGLAPSSLSHMMRSLETRMGVRLLNRTTRSVAPTEAGQRLFDRLSPVLRDLNAALSEVDDFRGQPTGTLRINTSEPVARMLLGQVIPEFLALYPQMAIDLVCEGRLVDVVADGFDAGIRLREAVPQDMIAVPFGGQTRFVVIGSADYLATRPVPVTPDDLKNHACIRHRMPSGKLYRWEFERHGEELAMDVAGPLTLDSIAMMVHAAEKGMGLACVPLTAAREGLAEGRLKTVLDDWCPEFDGLCLYYPGHRHVPAGLRAFIDVLKELG
jgi:DNA-binding transcriptional LysR family regulator